MLSGITSVSGLQPIADSLPSDHLTWRPVASLQPGFKITDTYSMLDLGFFNLHRNHRSAGDRVHPFASPEYFEPLRDCIVEAFGGHAHRVLNPLSVAAHDLAAFNRHSGDLTVSLFIRQPAAYPYNTCQKSNPSTCWQDAESARTPTGSNTVESIGDHYEFGLMTFQERRNYSRWVRGTKSSGRAGNHRLSRGTRILCCEKPILATVHLHGRGEFRSLAGGRARSPGGDRAQHTDRLILLATRISDAVNDDRCGQDAG